MSIWPENEGILIRNPNPEDFQSIQDLCKRVYPFTAPWSLAQLESHQRFFKEGQLVAVEKRSQKIVGMAFSLIISWDDYGLQDTWGDFTAQGFFSNHNKKKGKTLYGAEVMVDPALRGQGIGALLYQAREILAKKYRLKRIRAGARLRGYCGYAEKLTPLEYTQKVVLGEIFDPTLSFQLKHGFKVIDISRNYLKGDPESLGYAAVIEWLNPETASKKDFERQQDSIQGLISNEKFFIERLPKELRRLVRKITLHLGQVLRELEGDHFYNQVEEFRRILKKSRNNERFIQSDVIEKRLNSITNLEQWKMAHAFGLMLELINCCESAYRTWRLRNRTITTLPPRIKNSVTLVLTAHPTEARSSETLELLRKLSEALLIGLERNFQFDDKNLLTLMRLLWARPLAKESRPTVLDEARYLFSFIFQPEIFKKILNLDNGEELKLRTWVGGDKDGHPGVDEMAMVKALEIGREKFIVLISELLGEVSSDIHLLGREKNLYMGEIKMLKSLHLSLNNIVKLRPNDQDNVEKWWKRFKRMLQSKRPIIVRHQNIILLEKIYAIFPGLVIPLELRESSWEIKQALNDRKSTILKMLTTLRKLGGKTGPAHLVRGLVISHTESSEDLNNGLKVTLQCLGKPSLPVIPLFEDKESLKKADLIINEWLGLSGIPNIIKKRWNGRIEVMLGYSDSAKEIGVLPARLLINEAMEKLERTIRKKGLSCIFFHGNGGSIARGGGNIADQVAWWPDSAVQAPKLTIQGEMVQRLFSTPEILESYLGHIAREISERKKKAKLRPLPPELQQTLTKFSQIVEASYQSIVNDPQTLTTLLDSTPYLFLKSLKLGSRPSKRQDVVTGPGQLRAIPWILSWTQTRVLWPNWYGIGSAWSKLSEQEKQNLRECFRNYPLFSTFIKNLGFSLAKVSLDVWNLYLEAKNDPNTKEIFVKFKNEFEHSKTCLFELAETQSLVWFRPWLEESIKLRAPYIHLINLLQVRAMKEKREILLQETLVGISCGMLTTG